MKPISDELLAILVCPADRTPVRLANDDELRSVNDRQVEGALKHWNGKPVSDAVQALLIREDEKVAYRIRDGIPVMLVEEAIVLDDSVGPMPSFG